MRRFHPSMLTAGLAMTVLSLIIPGGVVIEFGLDSAPASGTATPLTISIQKGGLDYFGRILLAIPEDCTLSPKKLHGGSFALDEEEGRAVVSWLKLPEADRFDLQFDLKVAPDAPAGTREIRSEFSFIRNQDRASVTPPPFLFEVANPTGTGGDLASASQEASLDASGSATPTAHRTWTEVGMDLIVRIEVDGHDGGFMKLEESLPSGCDLTVLDAGSGTVQTQPDGFSVVWFDGIGAGSVVYQLRQCALSAVQNLSGSLSAVHDSKSVTIDVLSLGLVSESGAQEPEVASKMPEISFEVQVAATKKAVVTDYFKEKFNFRLPTTEEESEDWWKYSTGNHEEYAEARAMRNQIRENHQFLGPFIIARRNGCRISVQEALTTTGQQWKP
jgi:hypothetical protein